jgi:ribosomal protein S5
MALPLLADPTGRLMAHHLIDHPGRDAGILQPGREGVAEVVGAVQIHAVQKRVGGGRQRRPSSLVVIAGAGDQVGRHKFGQGDSDGA